MTAAHAAMTAAHAMTAARATTAKPASAHTQLKPHRAGCHIPARCV
jgi:hypothetical protein